MPTKDELSAHRNPSMQPVRTARVPTSGRCNCFLLLRGEHRGERHASTTRMTSPSPHRWCTPEHAMPLYFVRHGESLANEQNYFAGSQNSPLTRLGRRQAQQAALRAATRIALRPGACLHAGARAGNGSHHPA
ncbi:histidine phosphatase family protein [Xanthomonas campestris]|uniref:histidine phosphatase family protein n=1 Tax=Xanthomonas campestris TaxID=339 RepID=UPI003D810416